MNRKIPDAFPWTTANRDYLRLEVAGLRLILKRRALWLRKQWSHDAAQDYAAWRISKEQADWLLAGENREAETAFYQSDPEAAAVERDLAEVRARIEAQRRAMSKAGALAAIDILAVQLDLTAFERATLLLSLAPEIDPSLERLYAYLQDDMTRRHATPELALAALLPTGVDPQVARDSFLPDAPLRRLRLVVLEESSPPSSFMGRPLRVDERMLNFALGANRIDERVLSVLDPVPAPLLSEADRGLVGRILDWIRGAPGRTVHRTVNVLGSADPERLKLAQAASESMGLSLMNFGPGALPSSRADRRTLFGLIEREAVLLPGALYLSLDAVRPEERAGLVAEIDALRVLTFIGGASRSTGGRETLCVAVANPTSDEQTDLWRRALNEAGVSPNGQIEGIVEQFDLTATHIARAVSAARQVSELRSPGTGGPTREDFWRACEEQTAPALDALAQRITPGYSWNDIILPPEPLRQLREIAAQVAHRAKVYRTWGFGAKLSRGRGISALFAGPSGTGKTMAAEVIARHLGLGLYRIDLAGVVSKYIGETEKNLRSIFDAAERGGAILFFDEADALFGKRSEVKDSHDRYANIEVNYLLQRMEDFRGLAILATNRKASLDSAFVRRLRFIVDYPFPDAAHRLQIWRGVFPPESETRGIDFPFLSRLEIPGGHIRNVALSAAFAAASEGVQIGMPQIMRSARREYAKMERLVQESDFGPYYAEVMR